jgi:hypothetical protein
MGDIGKVSAASWDPDRNDVFADHNGNVWHSYLTPTSQGLWEPLGGGSMYGISAVSWGPGRVDVFAMCPGAGFALLHNWWDGQGWNGWVDRGGKLYSLPQAVSWGPERIDIFGIGTDMAVWHRWVDHGQWGEWESLGGKFYQFNYVRAVSTAPGVIHLVTFPGTSNSTWHNWYNGQKWSGWAAISPPLIGSPCPVARSENLEIFAHTPESVIYGRWTGNEWLWDTVVNAPWIADGLPTKAGYGPFSKPGSATILNQPFVLYPTEQGLYSAQWWNGQWVEQDIFAQAIGPASQARDVECVLSRSDHADLFGLDKTGYYHLRIGPAGPPVYRSMSSPPK